MATQTKSKTAKTETTDFKTSFDAFSMPTPSFEVPAAFREFAEKGLAQARDAYAKLKSAAEDTTEVVEDTFETARDGAFTFGVKAIDAVKANSDASFAFAKDLFGAKTLADVIELQTAFARQQFDTATAQFKEFQDLVQKVVTETAKPMTAHVEKTFKEIKAA
ncbi:MAG TPA: phasin [Bauldia sp.]|nr:phasin [Bauldia sp.]